MTIAEKQLMESSSEKFLLSNKDRRMEIIADVLKSTPVPETSYNEEFEKKDLNRKDSLHEKVFPDEAWSITSLPEGYECVDAMFMIEAEGICMLQQEIPVEAELVDLELLETKNSKGTLCLNKEEKENDDDVDDEVVSTEQEVLPQWSFPLETEEEKEMMEQKLVLEPHLLASRFVSVSMEYLEDSEQETDDEVRVEKKEDKQRKDIEKEVESKICPDSPSNRMQQLRIVEMDERDKNRDANERELECETCPSSSSTHMEKNQLRVIDAQVVCH